jgi:hypothetical protein
MQLFIRPRLLINKERLQGEKLPVLHASVERTPTLLT